MLDVNTDTFQACILEAMGEAIAEEEDEVDITTS